MRRFRATTILTAAALLALIQGSATVASAKEFDLTGTLDCGQRSGRKCQFADWSTGPTMGVLTKDMSGNLERVVVDASWVRDRLTDFDQDDFVWFTVRDDLGPNLKITSVVEHHGDGTDNQGLSNGNRVIPENGRTKKKEDS